MTKRDELIALGGIGVKVRELEWPPSCPRGQRVHNRPALVNYTVAHYGGDVGDAIYRWADAHSPWSDPLPTYETAKAAAQADYETRILSALEAPAAGDGEPVAWRDDPTSDEPWNAGCDFAMEQLCKALDVDPALVNWDAATETLDGDVQSVIWNIFRARMGEDWDPGTAPPADAGMRKALELAFSAMKDLRDGLHREPLVQGRKWVHLGSSLNDAIRKAELALTAPGATTKSDGDEPSSRTAGGFPVAAAPYHAEETGVIQPTRERAGIERGMDQGVTGGESATTNSSPSEPKNYFFETEEEAAEAADNGRNTGGKSYYRPSDPSSTRSEVTGDARTKIEWWLNEISGCNERMWNDSHASYFGQIAKGVAEIRALLDQFEIRRK